MVRLLVEDLGHDATEAPNGRVALDLLGNGLTVHLVVSDLNMPVMDGLALREQVEARWPELPFVLWSVATLKTFRGQPVERLATKDLFSLDVEHLLAGAPDTEGASA